MYAPFFEIIYSCALFLSIWHDSLSIPAYLSAISAVLLLLRAALASAAFKKVWENTFIGRDVEHSLKDPEVGDVPEGHSGPITVAFNVARLIGCLLLTGLSIASLVSAYSASYPAIMHIYVAQCISMVRSRSSYAQAILTRPRCCLQSYMSLLSLLSLITSPNLRRSTSTHLSFLLLVVFGVYVHRDIRPLATFSLEPVDAGEGWLLWSKVVVLAIIAVVVPLVKPRQYTSLDPEVLICF